MKLLSQLFIWKQWNWWFQRNDLIKSMLLHVQCSYHFEWNSENYSLQVNFNQFYGLETPSNNKLPWKFHEHVPPLNLRILLHHKKRMVCVCFCWSATEKHVVSRHVSRLFLNFWKCVGEKGVRRDTSSCGIYNAREVQCFWERVIICFVRARYEFHVFNGFVLKNIFMVNIHRA